MTIKERVSKVAVVHEWFTEGDDSNLGDFFFLQAFANETARRATIFLAS